jgi:hypothetical protein
MWEAARSEVVYVSWLACDQNLRRKKRLWHETDACLIVRTCMYVCLTLYIVTLCFMNNERGIAKMDSNAALKSYLCKNCGLVATRSNACGQFLTITIMYRHIIMWSNSP